MRRKSVRNRLLVILGATASISAIAGTAGAAPAVVDLVVTIGANTSNDLQTITPNGRTVTVTNRNFYVFVNVALITPQPGSAKVRAELGGGLRWGADDPDATERCTSTPTTGECLTGDLQPITGGGNAGWFWDVVAPGDGSYTFKAELVELGDSDPDPSNNASSITIVVALPTSAGGSGGGGSGGGASAKASAVKLSPAKPKAGSTVVAAVRVTKSGSPVRPTRIACSASIGSVRLKGASKSASGVASCLFKTPKGAKGKTFLGSVSFTAAGTSFTKRFAAKLG